MKNNRKTYKKRSIRFCGIFSFLEDVFINWNNGESVATVFCDFSNAFYFINHRFLLANLHYYGLEAASYKWDKS